METEIQTSRLNFGQALRFLKEGKKVARKGWNGKGMFVMLIGHMNWTIDYKYLSDVEDLLPRAFLAMKTVDDQFVPWVASQTDLLAEDWEVVL